MANLDSNINPIPNTLPGEAGKFFTIINARMREAKKKARDEAIAGTDVKSKIDALQNKIVNNNKLIDQYRNKITDNKITDNTRDIYNGFINKSTVQNNRLKATIDQVLTENEAKINKKYAELQNEKRIKREGARELRRQFANSDANREQSSAQVPSAEDIVNANKKADAIIADTDKLTEELDEEETRPAQAAAQAQENASADANKLAKVLVDSLMSAAQSPAPPLAEAETDALAPFTVTTNPQPEPVVETDNAPTAAVAETIASEIPATIASEIPAAIASEIPAAIAPEMPSTIASEIPAAIAPETIPTKSEITPDALANVIVNTLKLASILPAPTLAQTPTLPAPIPTEEAEADAPAPFNATINPQPAPVAAVIPAPEVIPTTAPELTPGELANVIVNALKLASITPLPAPIPTIAPESPLPAPVAAVAETTAPEVIPTIAPELTSGALSNVIMQALRQGSNSPAQLVQTPGANAQQNIAQVNATATAATATASLADSGAATSLSNVIMQALRQDSNARMQVTTANAQPNIAQANATAAAAAAAAASLADSGAATSLSNVIMQALRQGSNAPAQVTSAIAQPVNLSAATATAASIADSGAATTLAQAIMKALGKASSAATTAANAATTASTTAANAATTASTTAANATGVQSSDSIGFISLIQKYLEPIIGQFGLPETKPQKEFDIKQLPNEMQQILSNDPNINYIGRYRTDSKSDQNAGPTQTTYLFWNTDTHNYISHTVTDVVNAVEVKAETQAPEIVEENAKASEEAPEATQENAKVTERTSAKRPRTSAQEITKTPITRASTRALDKMPPMPPNTQTLTTKELLAKLPPVPTTIPQETKKRRIDYVPAMI